MLDMIVGWIMKSCAQPLIEFVNTGFFINAFESVFFIENMIGLDTNVIRQIEIAIFSFSGGLLTFKLLHKLFNIYILQQDGDSTVNPIEYLKGYTRGIVVSLTFTVAYGWMSVIVSDLGQKIMKLFNAKTFDIKANGTLLNVFMIVYFVFLCIIYIHFLMNGVRLYVLRITIPFTVVGLIDNDNGIYSVVIKKIYQTSATILIQMFLVQLSIIPIFAIKNTTDSYVSVMLAIAILSYSLKVTSDLSEMFLTSGASGGGSKLSSLGRGVKSVAGFLKK